MTLRDFKTGDKVFISMIKGTDRFYDIFAKEDTGSVFIWDDYTVTAEGRYSTLSTDADFTFAVNKINVDDTWYGRMTIPSIEITDSIRESRIHFKVIADKAGSKKVICYGEIWLIG